MKSLISILVFVCMSVSVSLAGSSDIWNDGWITAGEYAGSVNWTSNTQPLIVNGGGAIDLRMWNYSQLEVRSTSTPLGLLTGGIQYISLKDNSHLDYYSGETFNLTLQFDATADLYGGRIDYLTCFGSAMSKHVNIYALPGWDWIDGDRMEGIQGQWRDGSPFHIEFDNQSWVDDDPVWMMVNVIIPEPATLLLITLGCFLARKR